MINQESQSQKSGNILPAIIVTCLFLGSLAWIAMTATQQTEGVSFLEVGVALAALAYMLTFVDIRLGLALLILCVGLSPEVTVGGLQNVRLEDFLVPALLLAWVLRSTRTREGVISNPIGLPLWTFLGVTLFAAIWGIAMATTDFAFSTLIVGKNIIFILIFLIMLNHIRSYREFKAFVIFTLLVSIFAALTNSPAFTIATGKEFAVRVHGPFGETGNIFAGYLIMNICVLLGLFLHLPDARSRAFSLLACIPLAYTLLFTFSRTSYAALALSVAIFALFKHRRLIAIVLLAALVFPLVSPTSVMDRAATILSITGDQAPPSWDARVSAWQAATEKIYDRPLLGAGPGSVPFGWLDNEYVRVAVDMGVIGLAAFLWLLLMIGIRANSLYNKLEGPGMMKGYAAGYFMALMAILIHAMGATSFTAIRTMETFMILTAFMAVLYVRHEEWKEEEQEDVRMAVGTSAMRAMKRMH